MFHQNVLHDDGVDTISLYLPYTSVKPFKSLLGYIPLFGQNCAKYQMKLR